RGAASLTGQRVRSAALNGRRPGGGEGAGVRLGDPERGQKNKARADAYAETLREVMMPLAGKSTREIASILNARKIPTVRGGLWASPQVMRLMKRLGAVSPTSGLLWGR